MNPPLPASPPKLLYTEAESFAAHDQWGASCGAHSLSAACGKPLPEVGAVLVTHGWMNPTKMFQALHELRVKYSAQRGLKSVELQNGILRLQWEGKWLRPEVPPAAAYRYTHWIAVTDGWVLDTSLDPSQWVEVELWRRHVAEFIRERRYDGWHITHVYRIGGA